MGLAGDKREREEPAKQGVQRVLLFATFAYERQVLYSQ